jgi:hypothetical protein
MRARPAAGRRWWIATAALIAAFWLCDLGALRSGVPDPLDDTWEYGVAARHVLAGHGMRTDVIHPPLWSLRDANETVPVLVHGPLMPIVLAPLLLVIGPGAIEHLAWLSALAAIAAAWLTFRLGTRVAGAPCGAAAALLLTFSPLTLHAVHHDSSMVAGAALLAFALECLMRARPAPLAAGLAMGVAALGRAEFFACALLLLPLARRRGAASLLLGATLPLLPWWVHNARFTGNPFFNLSSYLAIGYWGARPGLSVLRDFSLAPAVFARTFAHALPSLPAKAMDFLPHAIKRALLVPSGGTGWLALLGAPILMFGGAARGDRDAALDASLTRRFAFTCAALACVPVAIMTLTVYDFRYLTPFLPLWALAAAVGASAVSQWLPSWGRRPRTWIGALTLMTLPSIAPALKDASREAHALEHELAIARQDLRPRTDGSRRLMFSDWPDFAAWTTRRPVVWISEREYAALLRRRATADSARSEVVAAVGARREDAWFHSGAVPESGGDSGSP